MTAENWVNIPLMAFTKVKPFVIVVVKWVNIRVDVALLLEAILVPKLFHLQQFSY